MNYWAGQHQQKETDHFNNHNQTTIFIMTTRDLQEGQKFRFKTDPETMVRRAVQVGKTEIYAPYDGQNTMGHSMESGDEVFLRSDREIILIYPDQEEETLSKGNTAEQPVEDNELLKAKALVRHYMREVSEMRHLLVLRLDEVEALRTALQTVSEWKLPETGKFWDNEQKEPMSYEAAWGSNGVRDYMRNVARTALFMSATMIEKGGADMVLRERLRQLNVKGYTAEHDDQETAFQLSTAAALYIANAINKDFELHTHFDFMGDVARFQIREVDTTDWGSQWPWSDHDGRRKTDIIDSLAKAGALVIAEIDRLLRLNAMPAPPLQEPEPTAEKESTPLLSEHYKGLPCMMGDVVGRIVGEHESGSWGDVNGIRVFSVPLFSTPHGNVVKTGRFHLHEISEKGYLQLKEYERMALSLPEDQFYHGYLTFDDVLKVDAERKANMTKA
jgi:hypothetical protein